MARLIKYNFLSQNRTIEDIKAGRTIKEYIIDVDPDCWDVVACRNGLITETLDVEVLEDDLIGFMIIPRDGGGGGGGSDPIRTVAMLAVVVTAAVLTGGGSLAGLGGFSTAAGSGLFGMSAAVTAGVAVGIAGSLLVNAVLPPKAPNLNLGSFDGLANIQQSATYGWDRRTNWAQAGQPIPYLVGKMKISPPGIAKHITTDGDTQTLHMLFLCGFGTFDSIEDVRINGESIINYKDATYDYRLGTLNQTLIPGFEHTYKDKDIKKIISEKYYSTAQTDGNAVTSISVGLIFGGLCYFDDNGNPASLSVKLLLEYSADGVTWTRFGGDTQITGYSSTWVRYDDGAGTVGYQNEATGAIVSSLPSGAVLIAGTGRVWDFSSRWGVVYTSTAPYTTVTAANNSNFYKKFTVDNLTAGSYQVRVKFYEAPPRGSRYRSDVMFEYLEEGVSDGFIYPMQALLAVHIKATSQLSGSLPTVECVASRGSQNPAVIVREAITNPYLKTRFAASHIIASEFDEWEQTCIANGYKANFYCDQKLTLRAFIDTISQAGQASVVQFGNKFGVIEDKPGLLPVQFFGMGNIIEDSMTVSYLPTAQRATTLNISYYDEELDYSRQELTLLADNTTTTQNSASFPLLSVTNRQKVIDFGTRQLNQNKHLYRVFKFAADKDAAICRVGDVVGLSHDILGRNYSGNTMSGSTDTVIRLDREVEILPGTIYYLTVIYDDNTKVNVEVENIPGVSDTVTLKAPILTPPLSTRYIFRENGDTDLLVRVTKINRSDEAIATLEGIEYIEAVYQTGVAIPRDTELLNWKLKGLVASDNLRKNKDGTIEDYVSLAWRGESMYYDIYVNDVFNQRVYDCQAEVKGLATNQTYTFMVKDAYGKSISTDLLFMGKQLPPPDVLSFDVQSSFSSVKKLVWDYPNKPLDFAGFEIRYCLGNTLDWSHGQKLHDGLLLSSPYDANLGGIAGTYTVMIKAVDTTGNYSINPAYAVFNEGDADVVNLIEEQIYDLSTVEVSNMELVGSTLKIPLSAQLWATDRTAPLWSANKTAPLWGSSYPLGYAIFKYKAPSKTGKIKLTIETDGVTNIYYRVNDGVLWSLDKTAPLWDKDRTKSLWAIGEWIPYTGEFDISLSRYEFKVEYPTQNYQSVLSHFSVIQDVEDISEEFNNLHISASGTRLPITKTYSMIKSVPASVQSDGNGGVTYQVIDKDPVNGALVKVLNSAGTAVNGIIDAKVIGYYAG